jgi:hypothetical protein
MQPWLEIQALVVALVLVGAGASKLLTRFPQMAADKSALAALLGTRHTLKAWRVLSTAELAIGVALVAEAQSRMPAAAATTVFAAAVGYLVWAWRRAPGAACGCFGGGGASVEPLTIIRACLLFAAALAPALYGSWTDGVRNAGPLTGALLAAEIAVMVAVSPEIHVLVHRWRSVEPACLTSRVPLDDTVAAIKKSRAWRRLRGRLQSENLVDFWRDGCWRFHAYDLIHDGTAGSAVFAVKVPPGRMKLKVAIVTPEATLLRSRTRPQRWKPMREANTRVRGAALISAVVATSSLGVPLFVMPELGDAGLAQSATTCPAHPLPLEANSIAPASEVALATSKSRAKPLVTAAALATADHERGREVKAECGATAWKRTIVVYVTDRALLPSQSLAQHVFFISRLSTGYRVWQSVR